MFDQLTYTLLTALTQMLDKLIQDNSAEAYTAASTSDSRLPSETPLTDDPGFYITLPLAPLMSQDTRQTNPTRNSNRRPRTPPQADIDSDDETLFFIWNRKADYSQTSDVTEQYGHILARSLRFPHASPPRTPITKSYTPKNLQRNKERFE